LGAKVRARRSLPHALGLGIGALALPLLLLSCGGFDNSLFGEGEAELRLTLLGVEGGKSPKEKDIPWVAVFVVAALGEEAETAGAPILGYPDRDGLVVFPKLPAGDLRILASDGQNRALELPLHLYAKRVRELSATLDEAVTIKGTVRLSDGPLRWATVSVLSLPFLSQELTAGGGQFTFRGLPAGCYDVEISHPAYLSVLRRVCAEAGEEPLIDAILGPSATGTRASCQACASGADCASGACVLDENGDGPDAASVCAVLCDSDLDCPQGFGCQSLSGTSARACLPLEASCDAFEAHRQGQLCGDDSECGSTGGICLQGKCALECSEDAACPGSEQCRVDPLRPDGPLSCG